jgi:hypothetical protein
VAGCCEHGDEPSGPSVTKLAIGYQIICLRNASNTICFLNKYYVTLSLLYR